MPLEFLMEKIHFTRAKIMEKEHLKIRKPLILLDLSVLSQLYPMGTPLPRWVTIWVSPSASLWSMEGGRTT